MSRSMGLMRVRTTLGLAAAAALLFAGGAAGAQALTVCDRTAPNVCGGTAVGGHAGVPPPNDTFGGVAGPDGAAFQSHIGGSMSLFGSGVGGLTANASGSGTYGEIHLSVFADNGAFNTPIFFTPDGKAGTFAEAEIQFLDSAIVPGALGDAVPLNMDLTLNGLFGGDGSVDLTFAFSDSTTGLQYVGSAVGPQTFNVFAGDQLTWYMDLAARAGTTNDGAVLQTSFADVSHTGRLYFDLPDGSGLIGLSGHNYASVLPTDAVPEPATWAMLLLGLGIVGASLRAGRANRVGVLRRTATRFTPSSSLLGDWANPAPTLHWGK